MKLTNKLRASGFVCIGHKNPNGSYACHIRGDMLATTLNCRPLDKNHAKRVLDDFWLPAMTSLIVVVLNGIPQVIDGRHRLWAGTEKGIKVFACEVHFDLTEQQALEMFYRLNGGRKNMNKNSNLKAAYNAGMPWAKHLVDTIESHGFTCKITKGYEGKKQCDLPNTIALEELEQNGDLERALLCLKAWHKGELDRRANGCPFLRGLKFYLKDNPKLSIRKFVNCFKKYGADGICKLASQLSGGTGHRVEGRHYANALDICYTEYYGMLSKAA